MLDAVYKDTMQPFHAYDVWKKFGKDEEGRELAHKEEWICCPDCKKPVTPRIDHYRTINGKKISVISCFQLKNSELGGCIHSESDEHRNAKILLANLLENEEITLYINDLSLNFKDLKIKGVPELPYRWEQKRSNRRSDVLIEFNEWHPILGRGIDFEIQKYKISEFDLKIRENDWVKTGYSLAWIPLEVFNEDSLKINRIEINVVWIYRLFQLKYDELSGLIINYEKNNEKRFNEIKEEYEIQIVEILEIQSRNTKKRIDNLEIDLKTPNIDKSCINCKYCSPDRRNLGQYVCWRGINKGDHYPPYSLDSRGSCVFWSSKVI